MGSSWQYLLCTNGLDGFNWLIYAYKSINECKPWKSLSLQVGIDDSLIEAGPLTTEDCVLRAKVGCHTFSMAKAIESGTFTSVFLLPCPAPLSFLLQPPSQGFHTLRFPYDSINLFIVNHILAIGPLYISRMGSRAHQMYQSVDFLMRKF